VQQTWIVLSLTVPVILHGVYDFILMTREDWLVLIVPFMIFLWWLGLRKVKKAKILTLQHVEKQYPI
jgi:protease PrsW